MPDTPTATSEAAPTATEVPSTPTAESHAPVIVDLVDQTIPDGERFPNVDLDEHVADADHAVDEITWHISGNAELKTRSIGRSLIISTPGGEWAGSETLRFEACDPDGLCDVVDVAYTVVSENDAPVITIDDQVILPGEVFDTIVLDKHVRDVDTPEDEITWSYSGYAELEVNITEGVLTVDAPDGQWHGSETIQLQACDPEGMCGVADVLFWVVEKTDTKVEIMYIGNEGFLITAGDKKILVDALFQTSPPGFTLSPAVVELMQSALPPFDNVDLVLATHSHHDHFHPGMVWQHLGNNPQALFVSTREAVDLLPRDSEAGDELRERIIPIQLRARERRQLAVNGIGLEIIYLSHGEDAPDNLGFIITVEGHRLFHMGDISGEHVTVSYLQAYQVLDKDIQVVFVPYHILSEKEHHPLVLEGIRAKYIIPMHWPIAGQGVIDTIHDYFPDAIFFHEELEIWAMPD
jgi:L-ascorbate metabolism protein UlaG (beta-lactamase superfamily)